MRRSILHFNAGLLALGLGLGGCTAILGIDKDYREEAGGTGGGGAGAGAGAGVPCGSGAAVCMDVPPGWSPVWVKSGANPTMPPGQCADASPQKRYFTSPAGAPPCAACSCTADPAAACGAPQISCYYGNATCAGAAKL